MNLQTKTLILRELQAMHSLILFCLDTIEEADPLILGKKGADLIKTSINEKIAFISSKIDVDPSD